MIKKSLRTAAFVIAAMAAFSMMSQDANAQCGYGGGGFSLSIGGGGVGFGYSGVRSYGGYGGHIGHGGHYGGINRGISSQSYRPSFYHDTSHFDYHPGRHVRHRNHFDYVPGHYEYHRTGHWHR